MSARESEPVRRNLLVVSSIFLLYFFAGGNLDHRLSTGLIFLEIDRIWVIYLAAWLWFGYAWLRYRLIFGTRASQFRHLIGGDKAGLHVLFQKTFDQYKQSQHFNIVKSRILTGIDHENCTYSMGLPNEYFPDTNSPREKDALTGEEITTSMTLLGGWAISYSARNTCSYRESHARGVTKVSFADAPFWRLQLLKQLFIENPHLTGSYFPTIYAQFAFFTSISFGLSKLFQVIKCWGG